MSQGEDVVELLLWASKHGHNPKAGRRGKMLGLLRSIGFAELI